MLDLAAVPVGAGLRAVAQEDRLDFQTWFRGGAGTHPSDALAPRFE